MLKSLPGREDTGEKREKRQAQLNFYLSRKAREHAASAIEYASHCPEADKTPNLSKKTQQ
jgi:hypothetical protein